MSFRLAAYAVCVEDGRVLLARHVPPEGTSTWTLPGGGVEQGRTRSTRWSGTPLPDVSALRRSSLVDVGLPLARTLPPTGHTAPVPVGGPIRH